MPILQKKKMKGKKEHSTLEILCPRQCHELVTRNNNFGMIMLFSISVGLCLVS